MRVRYNRSNAHTTILWQRFVATAALVALVVAGTPLAAQSLSLEQAVKSPARSAKNVKRDTYRHPLGVLQFFAIKPDDVVVEILPGSGGYYMEILAPYLREKGKYYAANRDKLARPRYLKDHQRMLDRIAAEKKTLGKVIVTKFNAGLHPVAPPGSADFVLTFRNLHNWVDRGQIDGALEVFHAALKKGGVLGVVDHRGRNDIPQEKQNKSGYIRQDYTIKLIENAGFKFTGSSEVNANPKDTKDHPKGVWTLPPALRLKQKDRAKYLAIGESDRFTLKFIKK